MLPVTKLPAALALLALLSGSPATAADWQTLQQQTAKALAVGDLDSAYALAQQALSEAEKRYGAQSAFVASSLNDLALINSQRGEHHLALEQVARAVQLSNQALGEKHANSLAILFNQGRFAARAQNYALAESAFNHYLQLEKAEQKRRLALYERAQVQLAQANYPAAEQSAREALALFKDVELKDTEAELPAQTHEILALALQQQGRLQEALSALQQALTLHQDGQDSRKTAEAMERLARLYQQAGQPESAAALRQQSLALLEETTPNSPLLAQQLNDLAIEAQQNGDLPRAENYYRRALALLETQRGAQSQEVATVLGSLGQLKQAENDDRAALALFDQSLQIYQQHTGSEQQQAQILTSRAVSQHKRRNFKAAESDFLAALALQEQLFGQEDIRLLNTLENLTILYRNMGQSRKANAFEKRAKALREKQGVQ